MKNEPAFPVEMKEEKRSPFQAGLLEVDIMHPGLTKREWFAGLAMQGFIAGLYAGNNAGFTVEGNCVAAVQYADALIAELEKTK